MAVRDMNVPNGMSKKAEETRRQVLEKCWNYLNHALDQPNFNKTEKLKIALTLCQKQMPTQIEGSLNFQKMDGIVADGRKVFFDVGDDLTQDVEYTGEAPSCN